MRRFLTVMKIETKVSLRCPDVLIFGVGMPIGVLLLIGAIGGDVNAGNNDYTFFQSAFAALLTVGICATAFMGIPLTIANYRDKKILKHFFVTPASPLLILGVQVIIAMIIACISALLVACVGVIGFDYHMEGNLLLFIGAYFLTMISMFSLGMIIASVCKNIKITNVVTTFVYFPMLFLSGATIPIELFPNFIQNIANVLPLTHGVKLLKNISLGMIDESIWISVLLLTIFAIVGVIVSIVSFKWE